MLVKLFYVCFFVWTQSVYVELEMKLTLQV